MKLALGRVEPAPAGPALRHPAGLPDSLLRPMVLVAMLLPRPLVWAADPITPKLYLITTETGMPHLEENMRYANTREQVCLGPRQLASAFPILRHEALAGCRLDHERRDEIALTYVLSCDAGRATTGAARWIVEADSIRGTLDVKLGAKNMTFYQRMTGRVVGKCVPAGG